MNNNNNNENKNGLLTAGIIITIIGFSTPFVFLVIIGVIMIIIAVKKNKKDETEIRDGEIRSGYIRGGAVNSMTDELAKYKSSPKNTYSSTIDDQRKYGSTEIEYKSEEYDECKLDGCNKNVCPVCSKVSANGYCQNCGFWFRH